ncbi:MAG: ComEC/Rec2 family competence protein, partial [Anaerolineae bacterium]
MRRFWKNHPAFFVGLHLFLGAALALSHEISLLIAALTLWIPLLLLQNRWIEKVLLGIIILAAAFVYVLWTTPYIELSQKTPKDGRFHKSAYPKLALEGVASFKISSIKTQSSFFGKSLQYSGKLKYFKSKRGDFFQNLPCTLFLRLSDEHPRADCDYLIEGFLEQKGPYAFHLKPMKKKNWKAIPLTFSAAEWRFQLKEVVREMIKKQISNPESASFLAALITGDIEEKSLRLEFGRLGLQHILAISGFHFALIAFFFGTLFRLLLPYKNATWTLLAFLSSYAFFIGPSPSVERAWIALASMLIGNLFNLRYSSLNSLGVG